MVLQVWLDHKATTTRGPPLLVLGPLHWLVAASADDKTNIDPDVKLIVMGRDNKYKVLS